MCRGFQPNERDRLKIKAFYVQLSVSSSKTVLPDSLTLHYLPRINGSPLEVNESRIRPDSPAFVTLHRILFAETATYLSRERIRGNEGVKFEIYMGDIKIVNGIFRKDERDSWKMECKCALLNNDVDLKKAEVCVAVEDEAVVMREKVEMSVRRKRRGSCFQRLEEIPEEREVESDESRCCCCECRGVEEETSEEDTEELEVDGVGWAVDVGIWVMCLGVGYLVTRASGKRLIRRKFMGGIL